MVSRAEESELDFVKDFLKVRGYKNALEYLENEERSRGGDKKQGKVR